MPTFFEKSDLFFISSAKITACLSLLLDLELLPYSSIGADFAPTLPKSHPPIAKCLGTPGKSPSKNFTIARRDFSRRDVITTDLSQVQPCIDLAKKFEENPQYLDCIFIGIGGSSLGPMCLLDSLKHLAKSKIHFHFFENPDPIDWQYRIKKLNPVHTLICVVTKSGTTYETLSLFMLAYDWLKKGVGPIQAPSQTIAITDPEKGELLEFAQKEKIHTLSIHPSVGGRFSVFTPVGLFAGALAGLDMHAFLNGGKKVRDSARKPLTRKIFSHLGLYLNSLYSTHRTHVMMPYSTSLRLLANWWVQLGQRV